MYWIICIWSHENRQVKSRAICAGPLPDRKKAEDVRDTLPPEVKGEHVEYGIWDDACTQSFFCKKPQVGLTKEKP